MTKQELLDAIRANWFSSDEDLVDFIFENVPEIKEGDSPVIHCKDCWHFISESGRIMCSCVGVKPNDTCTRAIKKKQINIVEEPKNLGEMGRNRTKGTVENDAERKID